MSYYKCPSYDNTILNMPTISDTVSGSIVTFNTSLALPLVSCKASIVAQGGGGTPSAPVAITGFDNVIITQTDKNGYVKSTNTSNYYLNSNGTLTYNSNWAVTDYIEVGDSFYYRGLTEVSATRYGCYYNSSKTCIGSFAPSTGIMHKTSLPEGTAFIRITIMKNTDLDTFMIYSLQNTFTLSLGQTVYGGEVGIDGNGVKTYKRVDMGNLTWRINTTDYAYTYFYTTTIDDKALNFNYICECFSNNGHVRGALDNNEIGLQNSSTSANKFAVRCDSITTLEAFEEFVNGKYVCYELAAPTAFSVTPVEISALVGENNIFADSGNISLQYQQTIQEYISQ